MIYTSYFGELKKIPEHMVTVAICFKPPEDWEGLEYRDLAPTEEILNKWKTDHDEEAYRKAYKKEILDKLNVNKLISELLNMKQMKTNGELVLLCYEESGNFCHRHMVAEWLRENGIACQEWSPENHKKEK